MADDGIVDIPLGDTVYGWLLLKTVDRLKSLNLPSIGNDKIELRKLAWATADDALKPPYVIVSPRPEITDWTKGTNERDDTIYAAMISIVLANARDVSTKYMGTQFKWRELVLKAFQNMVTLTWSDLRSCPFEGTSISHSYVEAGDLFIDQAKRMQYDAQYWLVRIKARGSRS